MFYTNVQCLGDYILERGIDDQGNPFSHREDYKPTLFIPTQKSSKWNTLEGTPVDSIQWGSIKETKNSIQKYSDVEGFDIYGMTMFQYAYICDKYPEEIINYDYSKIRIAIIDIEVASENGFPEPGPAVEEVTAISIKMGNQFLVYGCGDFINKEEKVEYIKCSDEKALLERFLSDWSKNYPDIITGWNTRFFDIPYLVNRINRLFGEKQMKKLSPWGYIKENKIFGVGGKETQAYELSGLSIVDYMDTYKKFIYVNQESYTLGHIAYVELGEAKLDYSEYDTLHELYKLDYQKFIEYNIKDVELVERLEAKMKLMEMVISLAYLSHCNYNDVFAQTRMWDAIIYSHLKRLNIVIPQKKKTRGQGYEGAYVKDPIIGRHDWVVSFDLNSLYPHLIMQYNISPETLQGMHETPGVDAMLNEEFDTSFLKEKNQTITPNGSLYSRDRQGFLPALMEKMYNDRVRYKKMLFEEQKKGRNADSNKLSQYFNMQMNLKIALNSAYGALGNEWFRFYDVRNAEAVSVAGQLSIRWAENEVNKYLNKVLETEDKDYVLASDTDSLYVTLDDLIKKVGLTDKEKIINFLDKVCEDKLEKIIEKCYDNLAVYTNAFQQKMLMKREVIADTGIWTSKKRYILNVHDSEGIRYETPKLKIMGIEAIRSSTPEPCRKSLKKSFNIIMNGTQDDVIEYIEEFKNEFSTLPAEDIAFPRSVKGLEKYADSSTIYRKSTPIHVKGSLIYNKMLKTKKLSKKYPIIKEGEKIKFVYLIDPNPTSDKVIAMLNNLPKEFELEKYIDYKLQFEKSFLEPLEGILHAIGWESEKKTTLDNFFV